jgi:hypothetical protein
LSTSDLEEQLIRGTKVIEVVPAKRGKPGRKPSTADIARFANERRPGKTWKEIYVEWKRRHPNDPRTATLSWEKVREAWRRHYRDKKKRAN